MPSTQLSFCVDPIVAIVSILVVPVYRFNTFDLFGDAIVTFDVKDISVPITSRVGREFGESENDKQ